MSHIPFWIHLVTHAVDDASSVSSRDYVNLVGNYNALITDKSDSSPELESRGYSPEVLALAKKQVRSKFNPVTSLGLRFKIPLSNFRYDLISLALVLFENYERGQLPFSGSVSEQPAQIMEIFSILQSLKSESERRELERQRRQVERGRNKYQDKSRGS